MQPEKIKILVVDDSDIIRHSLKILFTNYNFEVFSCLNGFEGIEKAKKYIPDLIFLDIMMPKIDGKQVLRAIKKIDTLKNIPVIIISGNTSRENVIEVLSAGADRVIAKPLQKYVIIKTIKELLGEDFLSKAKKGDIEEKSTEKQADEKFMEELLEIFRKQYPEKKNKLLEAIETKDGSLLSNISHEMKGVGSSIGYPAITEICSEVEEYSRSENIDWEKVKDKCEQFFNLCEKQIKV